MPETTSCTLDDSAIRERLTARPPAAILVPAVTLVCLAATLAAWLVREQRYISADRGLGYALGIAGLIAMLLLLLYPARKRFASMQRWSTVRRWFHFHMALGILGPTLALLHSNFDLGSSNSSVALFSALVVSASGYVGRFAYARIHYGLSGQRTRHSELLSDVHELRRALAIRAPQLEQEFQSVELWAREAARGPLQAAFRYLSARRKIARLRRELRRRLGAKSSGDTRRRLDVYLLGARRPARFRTYEQVFALWHALHIPISFFLYGAAVVHVIAVHLY
jgi:hypothetical protein